MGERIRSISRINAGASLDRPLRVVIAEGHGLVRAGLRVVLEERGDVTVAAHAATSDEAAAATRATRPDVVLMDLDLPGGGGIVTTRRILDDGATSAVRVVMLMTTDSEDAVFGALRAGATGLVFKDAEQGGLVGAVRAVAR